MSEKNIVEDEITYYVFLKDRRRHFAPQYLSAGATTVQWIFPIPEPNAVGTLDKQSNGLALMKFDGFGNDPECKVIAQYFSKTVCGSEFDYRFSPNFSEDTIAYSKTRIVVVANVKTGEAFHAGCDLSMDDYLLGIRFLDPQDGLFVVVKSVCNDAGGWQDYLQVVKLDGQWFVDTAWSMKIGETKYISPDFPLYHHWFVHDRKLFVYDKEWHKIACTDGKVSVQHPLPAVFNANAKLFGAVKDIAVHPTLPFGVIIEENIYGIHDLVVIRWDITNPKKQGEQVLSFSQDLGALMSLFGVNRVTLAYSSFSPDGNWYVVGLVGHEDRGDAPPSTHFVAIPVVPVDKEHPYFLDTDNLVILGTVVGLTSIAWTHEPTSYAVSNGELLHKWDLDELPNARVFEVPEDGAGEGKASIWGKIGRLLGSGK